MRQLSAIHNLLYIKPSIIFFFAENVINCLANPFLSIRNNSIVSHIMRHFGRFCEPLVSKHYAGLENNTKENDIATNLNQKLFTFWDEYRYIVPVTVTSNFTRLGCSLILIKVFQNNKYCTQQ